MSREPSVTHSTFTIERTYPATPARVFAAWASPATKRRWFAGGEGVEASELTMDFRVGGHELVRFRGKDGFELRNETVYQDLVPDARIVLAYTMTAGDRRISASLVTVELTAAADGTLLRFTEQAAFFPGADGRERREQGWNQLLEQLAGELRRAG